MTQEIRNLTGNKHKVKNTPHYKELKKCKVEKKKRLSKLCEEEEDHFKKILTNPINI